MLVVELVEQAPEVPPDPLAHLRAEVTLVVALLDSLEPIVVDWLPGLLESFGL